MSGRALPTFLELLGPRDCRNRSALTVVLGLALVVTTLIGAETALGFVFDPRYRDFPFASLTMAVVPFAAADAAQPAEARACARSPKPCLPGCSAVAALYTGFNEGSDNWQSLWTCAVYFLLAVTLWQARAAQNPE